MSVTLYGTGPSLTVELGISSGVAGDGVWDVSLWGTATWGPDTTWTDVSQYVQMVSTFRGRSREDDRYQAGSLTVKLKNTDARFTPGNTTGPYSVGGVTQLRPRIPIRVRATYNAVEYPVFYGLVSSFQDEFPAAGKNAVTTVTAVDPISLLTAFDGAEQSPQGAGELSGARIQRILNNAGWTLPTSLDTGTNTMQATTLAQNAWGDVCLVADSEGGAVWCEPDGTLVFEGRLALVQNTRSNTSQVTFNNAAGPAVKYQNPTVTYDDTNLYNIVRYARVGSSEITGTDINSRALYGDLTFSRDDLICETDAQVSIIVAADLERWRNPEYRVVSADIQPRTNPTVYWPQVLGRRIRDRCEMTVPVSVAGFTMTNHLFIDGMAHSFDSGNWVTTFYFASATPYDAYSASLFDIARFDSAVFFA